MIWAIRGYTIEAICCLKLARFCIFAELEDRLRMKVYK